MLKKLEFLKIMKKLSNRKKINKYNFHDELPNNYYPKINSDKKPKIVVYTCIIGGYDRLIDPLLHFENVDFCVYLDKEQDEIKDWKMMQLPEKVSQENNILANRYLKFHPHELFQEYDYSIYIDGNIQSIGDFTDFIYSVNDKTGLSLHRHQFRNCIFNEIEVCKLLKKGNYDKLKKQVKRYENDGFPKKFGMLECNVIVADLKNNNAKTILEDWWNEFKASESLRDQISLPYVLWKNGYTIKDVGSLGNNVYRNPKIRIFPHN